MLKEFKTRDYASNEARTEEYLGKFNRDTILQSLVGDPRPTVFDVDGSTGKSIIYMKSLFPRAALTSFEPNSQVRTP